MLHSPLPAPYLVLELTMTEGRIIQNTIYLCWDVEGRQIRNLYLMMRYECNPPAPELFDEQRFLNQVEPSGVVR